MTGAEAKGQTTAETSLQAGQLVEGKYRVERLIGSGGMAAVWAGTNERTGKRVALKVILRSLASTPAARELFYSEGLVASRVNHPNVVTVFDVIEHEGMSCMVMELLEGEPLSRLLERRGTLTVQEATCLLLPAMRGVAAAHAQGVVHRDLKPQNVFLCVEPNGRIVTTKVLDFGISVLVERVVDYSRGLSMGTPNYMSPENVAGVAVIDGRADVYGFGVLLYEALTGRMAFPGEPGPALFHSIMNQTAPPVKTLRPDIPAELAGIIDKAMAKQPDKRFPTLDAMIAALETDLLALGLGGPSPSALPGASTPASRMLTVRKPSTPAPSPKTMVFFSAPGAQRSGGSREPETLLGVPGAAPPGQQPARPIDTLVVDFNSGSSAWLAKIDWSSRLTWKLGVGAVVGIVLGFGVWATARPKAPVSRPGAAVEVVDTAAKPVPLAPPEPAAQKPAEAMPQQAPAELEKQTVASQPKKTRSHSRGTAMVASASRARGPLHERVAEKDKGQGAGDEIVPPAPRASSAPEPPSRAGSLSVDDF